MEQEKKRNTTVVVAGVGVLAVSLLGGAGYLAYLIKKNGIPERFAPKGPALGERDPGTGLHTFVEQPSIANSLLSVIK